MAFRISAFSFRTTCAFFDSLGKKSVHGRLDESASKTITPGPQSFIAVKVTFNWLKEFVDINGSPQELAARLTMAGIEVESVAPLDSAAPVEDWVLEVAVPPNRGDCLSVMGLAREVAAIIGAKPRARRKKARAPKAGVPGLEIKIEDPSLCPRYSACLVRNLRVGPSPSWVRLRLEACGIRVINNIVDVTNLVMLETGQPLHAFDWDKLMTKHIAVRAAENPQQFTTLDGLERELKAGDLLICDGDKPVALAGVMGGSETEVGEGTRHVLLESAHFDPVAIRRAAKRLGLHSEASYRFERFVDPEGTLFALDRAVTLLAEVADGKRDDDASDCWPQRRKPVAILLRDSRVRDLTGISIERNKIERLLAPLGLRIISRSRNGIKFIAPSYRSDLTREADLIEELVRLNGYDEVAAKLPLIRHQAKRDRQLEWERKIRSLLEGKGLSQVVNLTFTSSDMNHRFSGLWDSARLPVTVLNPLSQDHAEMRLSLVSNLVTNLRAHVEQKAPGLCVFEMGKVFARASAGNHGERLHLAGLCYGYKEQRGLWSAQQPWTFLDV
ncbi:MAG: phenylalanine--tRNA ligase subunit beta, partial [Candidatus Binatia bacterium]